MPKRCLPVCALPDCKGRAQVVGPAALVLKESAVIDSDVMDPSAVINVPGFRSHHNSPGIVIPDEAAMNPYITDIGYRGDYEAAFQRDAVIVGSYETVSDLHILAAYYVNAVSIQFPAYHVDVVNPDMIYAPDNHIPSGAVNESDVFHRERNSSDRMRQPIRD